MPCGCDSNCVEALQRVALHAHGFQREAAFAFVQQAQHRAFAVGAGQGGDPHINGALAQAQRNATVLRQAFSAMSKSAMIFKREMSAACKRAVGADHFAQRAIDAKAHTAVALIGFDVDVAGPVPRGLHQQGVEHADDGRVGRGFQQVFHGGQLLHHAAQIGFAFHLAHHQGRARLGPRINWPRCAAAAWRRPHGRNGPPCGSAAPRSKPRRAVHRHATA